MTTGETLESIVFRAETALMACLLTDPRERDELLAAIDWDWMLDPKHAAIGRAMQAVDESGKGIDPTTIATELRQRGQWGTYITASDMSRILSGFFAVGNGSIYLGQVRDYDTLRKAERAGEEITAAARSGMPSDKLVALAAKKVDALAANVDRHDTIDLTQAMGKALEAMRDRMASPGGDVMGCSGLKALDAGTAGGLRANQLTILAARPSVGKSSLACQYAVHTAKEIGPVLFVTLEMTWAELTERIIVQGAEVDFGRVRDGTLTDREAETMVLSASRLSGIPLDVMDAPTITVRDIIAKARSVKRKHGALSLVVIDYLQLLTPDNPRLPRQEQVSQMSRELKNGAKSLECPIICLAQLNRDSEKNSRAPKLSDLRESGAIEQDADNVMFLWRPNDQEREAVEIIVAKQRSGPIGKVPLKWEGRRVVFTSASEATRFTEFDAHNDFGFEPTEEQPA